MIKHHLSEDLHVFLASYDELEPDSRWLLKDEKIKSNQFKFPALTAKFIKRRSWIRQILMSHLGLKDLLPFTYNSYGKPELPSSCKLYFNYSHSKDYVLIALSQQHEVGCDIEFINSQVDVTTICHQFFSPLEVDRFLSYPKSKRIEIFYNLWTRKEAFIKANGQGLSYGLNNFSIEEQSIRHPKVISHSEPKDMYKIYDLDILDEYAIAVATLDRQSFRE